MSIKVKKFVKKLLTIGEKDGIILKLSVRKNIKATLFDIKHTVGNTFVCIIFQVVS